MARRSPSKMAVLFHLYIGLVPGGIWWVLLRINQLKKK
jgi:hypothetical protein